MRVAAEAHDAEDGVAKLRRKVAWHVLPPVVLAYVVAYLDRANVGFAKLRMAGTLKFSEEAFGIGFGIFFLGYLLLEIPGALIVERGSARKWFARILICWGFISTMTAFVRTPTEFCIVRFFLGLAEAGLFPGIIVYFTHWFSSHDRARALSRLIAAAPISLALGAPLSALLLDVHWLNLAGWQWLFLLEGLPAVVLGIAALFWISDRPEDAPWLTHGERRLLDEILAQDARQKGPAKPEQFWRALRLPNVWLLATGIFAANTGGYALVFWLPTTLKYLSGGSDRAALLYSCFFYSFGVAGVILSGLSSDRTQERKWHCAIGMAATAVLLTASTFRNQPFGLVMAWLCLTAVAAYFWASPFWALPTQTLAGPEAAVSIGAINIAANIAGYLGNSIFGTLRGHGVNEASCLMFCAFCYLTGSVFVSFVKVPPMSKSQR